MVPDGEPGWELDPRSDLFSLGACSTKWLPVGSLFLHYQRRRLRQHLAQRSRGSRHFESGRPTELERILNKALEKDRDVRYQVARNCVPTSNACSVRSIPQS